MPPKPKVSVANDSDAFTPERFEKELKTLAAKAKGETKGKFFKEQASTYIKTTILLTLAAIYSNVSQLALSPVYGSIPSSIYHAKLVMVACFFGWSGNVLLNRTLPFKTAKLLPVIALTIPTIQFYLYKTSATLTAHWGPLATEAVTLFPLILVSVSCVATELEKADLSKLPKFMADAGPGLGSWGLFKFMEKLSGDYLQAYIGKSFFQTRIGLEALLAAAYSVYAPSKLLLFAIPTVLHTAVLNTHALTPMAAASLNSTLLADDWFLLDRKESITGYVSVLESIKDGYRVLRCDHSLLGGEWVRHKGRILAEPIYGVFVMLEAVRLVKTKNPVPDNEAKALNIGLGIGTTPGALIAHGIDTTIVEIDPVVHEFASKYFDLPSNHTPVIADAVSYTAKLVDDPSARYDYIVHDVFTGGAEPVPLFTLEFLQGLNSLLKPDGVIAINYAGDFLHPAPKLVVDTIREVFPSCRIFRESEHPSKKKIQEEGQDFTNMVIFCKKTSGKLFFRKPTEEDFLASRSRQVFLQPRHEVLPKHFLDGDFGLLRNNATEQLTKWHEKSALGHWEVMRVVLPAFIWENW
ncbi:Polyamine aminopropyltransferase [Colletotrichum aenigma]|uniref:Polyamine aminopropyltransferase n=1 Tax=Colletotrichum aenigma TaxID=1215731 RepID=UPI0018728FF1|nr:Polyamine aminopropyltransferase [Colletotrichum aenigma]KAF5502562.1 Polyamine aminopropyltransferase [Colletotrichum aenigma]